jgi:hypothetical protein
MTPSNEFLKSINLSTEIYERLLNKLTYSLYLLQDRLFCRNQTILYNRTIPKDKQRLIECTSSDYKDDIRDMIVEVRLYKGYLHTISLLEASYEREQRRDW